LSSLVFLYAIFLTFLEGKLGHPFLEGKGGQDVQNLLQVTGWFIHYSTSSGTVLERISSCAMMGV
jgi:hypothetical protein